MNKPEKPDFEQERIIREFHWRKDICDIVSRMLDNPSEIGIYPTTKCYEELLELARSVYTAGRKVQMEVDAKIAEEFKLNPLITKMVADAIRNQ